MRNELAACNERNTTTVERTIRKSTWSKLNSVPWNIRILTHVWRHGVKNLDGSNSKIFSTISSARLSTTSKTAPFFTTPTD